MEKNENHGNLKVQTKPLRKAVPEWMAGVFWVWWSNLFMFIGSVLWLISPIYCWTYGEPAGCEYVALLGSFSFLLNGILDVIDWWVWRNSGEPMLYKGGVKGKSLMALLEKVDWYLLTNLTFFLGAFGDITTTALETWVYPDDDLPPSISDFVACTFWVFSGFCQVLYGTFTNRARRYHNAPVQFTMLPWKVSSSLDDKPLILFDWFGWGDSLFLPGGLSYAVGAVVCYFSGFNQCWFIETMAGLLYLLDAMFYWPDLIRMKLNPEFYDNAQISFIETISRKDSLQIQEGESQIYDHKQLSPNFQGGGGGGGGSDNRSRSATPIKSYGSPFVHRNVRIENLDINQIGNGGEIFIPIEDDDHLPSYLSINSTSSKSFSPISLLVAHK